MLRARVRPLDRGAAFVNLSSKPTFLAVVCNSQIMSGLRAVSSATQCTTTDPGSAACNGNLLCLSRHLQNGGRPHLLDFGRMVPF